MLAWILLLVLIVAEVAVLWWWLRREFYPVFFNGWAALIYSVVLAADFILAWLVSMTYAPGGTNGTLILALLGVVLVVVVFVFTLFFRWVIRHDMTDISKK